MLFSHSGFLRSVKQISTMGSHVGSDAMGAGSVL